MSHESDYKKLIAEVRKIDTAAADYLDGPCRKLVSFSEDKRIQPSFLWDKTPQGVQYWWDIQDQLPKEYQ